MIFRIQKATHDYWKGVVFQNSYTSEREKNNNSQTLVIIILRCLELREILTNCQETLTRSQNICTARWFSSVLP